MGRTSKDGHNFVKVIQSLDRNKKLRRRLRKVKCTSNKSKSKYISWSLPSADALRKAWHQSVGGGSDRIKMIVVIYILNTIILLESRKTSSRRMKMTDEARLTSPSTIS